ncbi:C-terminal binding protein [candidate division KSB1 bacterium]|nr:C-terminal binding protein [candidate division KSB1 bacterium]
MNKKVLIPDRLDTAPDIERDIFGPYVEILTPCVKHSSEIEDTVWSQTDAILAWHELKYDEQLIEKLDNCKVIVRVGVGFDNVDLKAAGHKGIYVCNVPDYGTTDVADHAMALMLMLSRGVYAFSEQVRISNDYWEWEAAGTLHRVSGATLGIIGLGRIGIATALRAKSFGMNVIYYDPYIPDGRDKALGVTRCDELSDLLSQSDIVTIHTPLTDETRNMASFPFFASMKKGALFINVARGPIVNLDALMDALKFGALRAVGLDVMPEEPPNPDHPLIRTWRDRENWIANRLVMTPHAAFYCHEAYQEMRMKAAMEAKRILNGQPPRNCVNREWL